MKLFQQIITELKQRNIDFELLEHQPVFTSEIASKVLNHPEAEGTKSLALKTNKSIVVATVAGNERLDFKMLKQLLKVKKISMCELEILPKKLGTEVGGVAPFGYDSEVKLVVSSPLFAQANIYINPGRNDLTLKLKGQDFASVMLANNALVL